VLALLGLFLALALARRARQTVPFTPGGWANHDSSTVVGLSVRQRMLPDFLAHHRLEGMTRDSVTALLGEPEHEGRFHGWDLAYWLGPERTIFGNGTEWLVVMFDAEGQVSQHDIKTD